MRLMRYFPLALLAVVPGMAENNAGPIAGPVLGFADKSSGVRPVIGSPGAAYFLPALKLDDLKIAAMSPEPAYAVLLTPDRGTAIVAALRPDGFVRIFESPGSPVNNVSVSAGGTAAALVRGGHVDILSGLPANPVLNRTVETPTGTTAVAVSDDGEALAIFDGSTVSVLDATGQKALAAAGSVQDLRFRQNTRDITYIDGGSVMMASSGVVREVAGSADNISSPRSAVFTRDGRLVLIAEAASKTLLTIRSSGGVLERVPLPCVPGGVSPINDSTFWLRCESGEQFHLIQLTPDGTRVLFIPEPVE